MLQLTAVLVVLWGLRLLLLLLLLLWGHTSLWWTHLRWGTVGVVLLAGAGVDALLVWQHTGLITCR